MSENTSLQKKEYFDERDTYARSNFMISSKYKSTLFSNRLMAISLSRLGSAEESNDGYLTVRIKGRDIQNLFGVRGNGFFTQLSNTANSLTGHTIGWSNPETQEFEYIAAVTKSSYKDGEFSVVFHRDLKQYLVGLERNYTKFSLEVMLSFKSTYSFRLYELLRSRCYHRRGDDHNSNLFLLEFDLNELRLDLGVVNAELESVRKILNGSKGKPDWEKAVSSSPEHVLDNWKDFKRKVLTVGVNEINEKPQSGIHIDKYEPKKAGRGGKIYAVVFYVEVLNGKKDKKHDIIDVEENKDDLIDEIRDIITKIKSRDARAIGEAADWDLEKIERNYEYSKTKDVEDIVGFMIKAVKEDWASTEKQSRKKTKGAKNFDNFNSREYNYDELMEEVLKK